DPTAAVTPAIPALSLPDALPSSSLAVLALFDFGFIAMALGLLVALLRFRLWEADTVIGRSAVSAAVTVSVGILWTLSTDLVKIADRKSTRLNSSHVKISYAVFCL